MKTNKTLKNRLFKVIAFTSLFFAASTSLFSKDLKGSDIPDNLTEFNGLICNPNAIGKTISSPCNGKVIGSYKSGKSKTISIEVNQSYYWKDEIKNCTYQLIITNINDFTDLKEVKYGEGLGTITKDTCLIARSKEADPYLVRLTNTQILKYKDYYYFQPAWILNSSTTFLDYRAVESLEDHANDFYNRWESEYEELEDNRVLHVSLFNWPELDSIRVKIVLNEYPQKIQNTAALNISQSSYFGRTILEFQTPFECNCPYTPYLYWQSGFDEYLKNEYTLGTDLYVYCTFLALDHDNKRIIINVRDFNNRSDEDVYEERITEIIEKK